MKEKALYRYLLVDPDFRTIVITFHSEHQMQVMCTYVHKSRLSLKRKASHFISEKITATNVSVAHLSKNPIFVPKVNLDEIFHNHIDWKLLKTSKCRIWIFQFWHFPPKFVLLKSTCLVTLFDRKFEVFKKSPKRINFSFFYWTFVHSKCKRSPGNVVKGDFFYDFQTPCAYLKMVVSFGLKLNSRTSCGLNHL